MEVGIQEELYQKEDEERRHEELLKSVRKCIYLQLSSDDEAEEI